MLPAHSAPPSRASIISGQYPSRHGAWSIGTDTPDNVTSVAGLLTAAGYRTGLVGKSHFKACERPGSPDALPRSRGFQNWNYLVLVMAAWREERPYVTEF